MTTKQKKMGIKRIKSDGVTVFEILGLENDIKAYKEVLKGLHAEIQKQSMKIVAAGQPIPVVRLPHSLEIH
jgi:hypothetical protein